MQRTFRITPRKVSKILLTIIFFLFVGHLMYLSTQVLIGYKYRHIFAMFDFNSEGNLPTLYSVAALVVASLILFFIGVTKKKQKDRYANHWLILGALFFLMSYDEGAQMHERLNVLRDYLPEGSMSLLHFAWVIPYFVLVVAVGLYFIKFLRNLPQRTALLFISSGVIFVTGAMGFELFSSYFYENRSVILAVTTIEELLEMLGIVLFIYSLLDYIKTHYGHSILINFDSKSFEKEIPNEQSFELEKESLEA